MKPAVKKKAEAERIAYALTHEGYRVTEGYRARIKIERSRRDLEAVNALANGETPRKWGR
jgi:hypothetical protein